MFYRYNWLNFLNLLAELQRTTTRIKTEILTFVPTVFIFIIRMLRMARGKYHKQTYFSSINIKTWPSINLWLIHLKWLNHEPDKFGISKTLINSSLKLTCKKNVTLGMHCRMSETEARTMQKFPLAVKSGYFWLQVRISKCNFWCGPLANLMLLRVPHEKFYIECDYDCNRIHAIYAPSHWLSTIALYFPSQISHGHR